jgi:hypothetical protein
MPMSWSWCRYDTETESYCLGARGVSRRDVSRVTFHPLASRFIMSPAKTGGSVCLPPNFKIRLPPNTLPRVRILLEMPMQTHKQGAQ